MKLGSGARWRTACLGAGLIGVGVIGGATSANAQGTFTTTLIPSGAGAKLRGYMPARLELTATKPAGIVKLPADLTNPLFGTLSVGKSVSVAIVLDQPTTAGTASRLFVDANANGDLTDDPRVEWKPAAYKSRDGADLTRYMGEATIPLADGGKVTAATIRMYLFDPNDTARAALKNVLLYYRDYARQGTATLGGKTYAVLLDDLHTSGDFSAPDKDRLMIDVTGDGMFAGPGRTFDAGKPFNITGATYVISSISPDGSTFTIVPSKQTVAVIPAPPVIAPGKPALAFSAKTTDGKTVDFPSSYKGRLVLLDFWATWCGPCKAELPKLTAAYTAFHDKGFDVLGISLDQPDAAQKLADFTRANGMPWPQVYDGKFWKAEIAQLYGIQAIPAPILVDGDTGAIVASGESLRGDALAATLSKALAARPAAPAKVSNVNGKLAITNTLAQAAAAIPLSDSHRTTASSQ